MRILVLGGTRFIGRAIVEQLATGGHEVTVVHRGVREPEGMPDIRHLHLARAEWPVHSEAFRAVQPEAVIDCMALRRSDARAALAVIPDVHVVVLSSQDVYRAFASLQHGLETDAVPIDEDAPLRDDRYPHRGEAEEFEDYSKLDVEEEYAPRSATILRLPATYGEWDPQRREEFILRRVRAGRRRIPIGGGALAWTRGYVRDVARPVCSAVLDATTAGDVFNVGESRSWTVRQWAARILEAAGSDAELATVPDAVVPRDLQITATTSRQHVLVSTTKARMRLGCTDTPAMDALRASVQWHLAHPPEAAGEDFTEDDAALTATE